MRRRRASSTKRAGRRSTPTDRTGVNETSGDPAPKSHDSVLPSDNARTDVGPRSSRNPATASGRTSSRLAWTVADQVLSSGTNFALGILIARTVSVRSFGIFTLTFAAYQIFCGISRALVSEPLVVRFTRDGLLRERGPVTSATGASLLIGGVVGLGIVLVASLLSGESRNALLVLGVSMPGLLLQDCWRFVFFAAGRPAYAAVNDGLWAVLQLGLVITLIATRHSSVVLLLAAWCASGLAAALVGLLQARVVPSLRGALGWASLTRDLSSRFLAEFSIGNGLSQVLLWLVSFTAGIVAAGSLRAAQLLLGPPRVIVQASYSAIVPEGVRLRRRHPHAFSFAVAACGVVLAGSNLLWGGIFLALPGQVGHALLGKSWASARPLIVILAISGAAFGAQTAAISALRVFAAANRSLRARMIGAPVTLLLTIAGAAVAGAMGAAIGIAVGSLFSAVVTWIQWLAVRDVPATAIITQPPL
jgi:O-antigen/teichoic acid export membrane protein